MLSQSLRHVFTQTFAVELCPDLACYTFKPANPLRSKGFLWRNRTLTLSQELTNCRCWVEEKAPVFLLVNDFSVAVIMHKVKLRTPKQESEPAACPSKKDAENVGLATSMHNSCLRQDTRLQDFTQSQKSHVTDQKPNCFTSKTPDSSTKTDMKVIHIYIYTGRTHFSKATCWYCETSRLHLISSPVRRCCQTGNKQVR